MTVSYQYDVASSSTAGFFRLLWRWRGSIWKLLYKELLLFLAVYMCIAFTYDFLMTDYYKKYYEHIVIFCSAFVEVIPLSFILGFYVSFTATRWWQQYTAIPWPDKLMNIIALYIPGNDVTSRVLRRTLMRYLNLTLVLVLRSISIPVKRRFPTKEHLVEAGFMSRPELEIYQSVPSHEFNTFWIPCTWFVNLLREAKSECRITDSGGIKLIMEEFNEFRSKCGLLWSYDWVSIPLVYTQVVTLSTQAFFLASLLGRQHINSAKPHIYGEYYIPIFTMLQFILYMGLLKLGEQLINPFGDDDEDFELNWIIDRHLKVSFLGVDILNSDPPPLIKDNYFDEMDIKLPYTEAAVAHKVKTYRGSVAAFHVPTDKHGLVIPEFEDDNNADSDDEPSTIQSNRDAVSRNNSWSLFNQRKRKLSSSFDSFNSELMVETGLSESEMPELVSTHSSWPTFLRSEQQRQQQSMIDGENNNNNNNYPITTSPTTSSMPESLSSKLSVWPINCRQEQRKANEDTQGIRWSENDGPKDEENNDNKNRQQQQQQPIQQQLQSVDRRQPELYKQSSFSTSDSSIVIPMGETTSQWPDANSTARIFRPRKSPLQVFSKEMANAPISVFNQILESNLRRQSKNSSLSSLGSTTSPKIMNEQQSGHRTYKPYKSLMKSSRQVDPKLRIRPFRSKVTFSVDTKNDDNTLQIRGRGFNFQYDSSSESNSSLMKAAHPESSEYPQYFRSTLKRSTPPLPPSSSATAGTPFSLKTMQDSSFHENSKRRQSMDPTIYQRDKPVSIIDENKQDNWLHYQSLPNIQEEELIPLSSSFNDAAPSIPGGSDSLTIGKSNITKQQQQPYQPQQSQPKLPQNIQSGKPEESKQISPSSSPKILLEMNPLSRSPSSMNIQRISSLDVSEPGRKKSFKRQKSQEISDEDLKIRLSYPLTAPSSSPTISCDKSIMKKQSSSDSQGSNTSATNNKTMIVPPVGILKKKNDQKISTTLKQASTESDTGSYHTVRSLILNPSSSSIDSFTSAVSDSINNSNDNNKNSESNNDKDQIKKSPTTPTPTELSSSSSAGLLTDNRLLSFTTLESSLVPKIIFSQSTPSVTSQSSDDQNSPKWYDDDKNEDDRYYSEFSSLETVIHGNILSSDDNKTDQDNNSDNSNDRTLCKQKHKQQQKQPKKSSITSTTSSTSPPKSSTSSSSSSTSSSTSSSSTLNKSSLNKKNSIKR